MAVVAASPLSLRSRREENSTIESDAEEIESWYFETQENELLNNETETKLAARAAAGDEAMDNDGREGRVSTIVHFKNPDKV